MLGGSWRRAIGVLGGSWKMARGQLEECRGGTAERGQVDG